MSSCDETHRLSIEKSLALASFLFPDEKWIPVEPHIWAAKSRLAEQTKELEKWGKEIAQVRILVNRGSVVYFLPERKPGGTLFADTVINGEVTELKTVTGNRSTLGWEFRQGYKQGEAILKGCSGIHNHSVFVRLISDLSVGSVKAKIAGELKEKADEGNFICYFEQIDELFCWTYTELRAIIGSK